MTRDGQPPESPWPAGHFYSPLVDVSDVERRRDEIWPPRPVSLGIDFNDASHQAILRDVFPKHIGDYDYPETPDEAPGPGRFYTRNPQFSWLDARTLFVLLRELRPRRMVEVGGGHSTRLTADVNTRFLSGAMRFTCIEPYPSPALRQPIPGLDRLIERRVQEAGADEMLALERGDVLFIDSSHVAKTGSDVNYLLFEILPRLAPGVTIHVHDIFLPHDYPREWVLGEGRSWNEQYVLRALLSYSSAFSVLFGCSYAYHAHPELVREALRLPGGRAFGGGSFWFEKLGR